MADLMSSRLPDQFGDFGECQSLGSGQRVRPPPMAQIQESGSRDIRNIARVDKACWLTARGYSEFGGIADSFKIERWLSEILHEPVRSKDRPGNWQGFDDSLDLSLVRQLVSIACVDLRQQYNPFNASCRPQEGCDGSSRIRGFWLDEVDNLNASQYSGPAGRIFPIKAVDDDAGKIQIGHISPGTPHRDTATAKQGRGDLASSFAA